MLNDSELRTDRRSLDDILTILQRLDQVLEQAIATAHQTYGAEATTDPYRGLHISPREVERLLGREPGAPILWNGRQPPGIEPTLPSSRFAELEQAYGLSPFDMDVVAIALAPDLDLRYERLYAYLQDNVTRKRPTVDLALNLLCPSIEAKLQRRSHFAADAPLIHHRLLHLWPDPNQPHSPLLAHSFRLDEQILRWLLGQTNLDDRLVPLCQPIKPTVRLSDLSLKPDIKHALQTLTHQVSAHHPLHLYFQGVPGVGKQRIAEALAHDIHAPLLITSLESVLANSTDTRQVLTVLFREARLQNAVLYLDVEALPQLESSLQQQLVDELLKAPGLTILAGTQPWSIQGRQPLPLIPLTVPMPDAAQRRDDWHTNMAAIGLSVDPSSLTTLADRFQLVPAQISQAVTTAIGLSRWRTAVQSAVQSSEAFPSSPQPSLQDLFIAARAQSGQKLATLAVKINPVYTWADLVLPDDATLQLREICQRVAHRHQVLDQWGFDRRLSLGKGVNALFAGASGTGKTMAAEVIATELGLDLYKIDLSSVVSKYIGETEKNLEQIFRAAENANAILLFDEADALFGKRSEVRDSHDRYANLEISYLLQKMEQYEGVAILATNLRGNLDEAFVRRLAFTVYFPSPDAVSRRQIWAGMLPVTVPLAADVDLDVLAHQFPLSGGNIKNIALAAAYLAAADHSPVTMHHLRQATRREYQKLGKVLSDDQLNGVEEPLL